MYHDELLEHFSNRKRSPQLPLVENDEVEVLVGVYAGKRGVVEEVHYAETPLRFLVDFRDGTDQSFPASELKLLPTDA
jgi:transcription antitermination factor NusG